MEINNEKYLVSEKKKPIKIEHATTKMLYYNIMEGKLDKTIKPKDNQEPDHLKYSFKWIAKAQIDCKVRETSGNYPQKALHY